MSLRSTLAIAAPLLLALSACGDDTEVAVDDDGREASGEVLDGTISDEMIPLDEMRSQAPLAEAADGEENGEGGGEGSGETDNAEAD
ncbi:hypothetical protein [Aurantiacibacter rhizosphaerae]|uniref:Argininosuccinate lyase n=1 Tax=Aurantiacibacter rhizosphaerae TaxID=2691582 RepID=A0A844XC63_9SPHN|nr:hypothetical protein [Aurantiacibacter rhizosphaerae]MWV27224.1 hypothetical protein [Aurantiacibacter rhizosphaerae]